MNRCTYINKTIQLGQYTTHNTHHEVAKNKLNIRGTSSQDKCIEGIIYVQLTEIENIFAFSASL